MNYEHYDSQTGRCKRCGEGPVSCVCPPVMLSVVEGKSQEERDREAFEAYFADKTTGSFTNLRWSIEDHMRESWQAALKYARGGE